MHGWACHREVIVDCSCVSHQWQRPARKQVSESHWDEAPRADSYHCVSKRCLYWGGAWLPPHLRFRPVTYYAWNLLWAYLYRWPGFSLWIFLVVHTNRVSCLSSVALGTTDVFWEWEFQQDLVISSMTSLMLLRLTVSTPIIHTRSCRDISSLFEDSLVHYGRVMSTKLQSEDGPIRHYFSTFCRVLLTSPSENLNEAFQVHGL